MAKGRRVCKQEGVDKDFLKKEALDRDHKSILSTSPLKLRKPMDLYGSPDQY